MKKKLTEQELAATAKDFRKAAGKSKVEVARELDVAPPTVFNAEEHPELSLTKLRVRIIETYSDYKVTGPFYVLEKNK